MVDAHLPWADRVRHPWDGILYAILLASVAAACFASTAQLGLDTHDDQMFRDNALVLQDWRHLLSGEAKENHSGRPVAELAKSLGQLAWGPRADAFHLYVVALHTLAAWGLARVALALGSGRTAAGAAGLLFLVNVAHFQAIFHISALDYPLALVFSWGAVLTWLRWLRGGGAMALAAFVGLLMLALMSHLSSAAVLALCLWLTAVHGAGRAALARLAATGGFALALTAILVRETSRNTSTWHSVANYGRSDVVDLVGGCARMLLWFLGRLGTTAHWLPLDFTRLHAWELGVGAVALAGLAALVWTRHHPGAAWSVWTLASLLPFVLLTETTILDMPAGPSRYLYPASAGSSALLVLGGVAAGRRAAAVVPALRRHLGLLGLAGIGLLVLVSGNALHRAQALFFYTSGRHHLSAGQVERAGQQLRRAIDRGGDRIPRIDAYLRLAGIRLAQGDDVAALAAEATARVGDVPVLRVLSAVARVDPLNPTDAAWSRLDSLTALSSATTSDPESFDLRNTAALLLYNRSLSLQETDRFEAAAALLQPALRLAPADRRIAENLAAAWYHSGRFRRAGDLFEQLGYRRYAAAAFGNHLQRRPEDDEIRRRLEALAAELPDADPGATDAGASP